MTDSRYETRSAEVEGPTDAGLGSSRALRLPSALRSLQALGPWARIGIAAALAVVLIGVFLTIDLGGAWQYILRRRSMTVLTMVLVGSAIGMATVGFQTITHNRILTPSVMGFDALFMMVVTVTIVMFGAARIQQAEDWTVFAIQAAVMMIVSTALYGWLLIGARRALHVLLLVGIILGVLLRSLISFIQRLLDPNEFQVLEDMSFASFNLTTVPALATAVVLLGIGIAVLLRLHRVLDVMALGRDLAVGLGIPYQRIQMLVLIAVTLLVSAATALAGPTTFFGLLVAHMAYATVASEKHRHTLPMAAVMSVIALVGGQLILERVLGFATALSVVVDFAGGLLFILLLIRKKGL
ncbi:iron chelate uptake ABC transporter family permease subunit [Helcobacillus massiliensis]|uniref:Iron complex transport system permease protein n=1 Tax=Helcobacillus massiliensis TaxID=521392 RepID=A0A839QT57_9MICO|nr:iron chelate uptake ABC transporter family permease subunit [Helcobacillus massiliensis]MBB3023494.1 iron complex transport system permease protein [Helcobacillus massiliensis]